MPSQFDHAGDGRDDEGRKSKVADDAVLRTLLALFGAEGDIGVFVMLMRQQFPSKLRELTLVTLAGDMLL